MRRAGVVFAGRQVLAMWSKNATAVSGSRVRGSKRGNGWSKRAAAKPAGPLPWGCCVPFPPSMTLNVLRTMNCLSAFNRLLLRHESPTVPRTLRKTGADPALSPEERESGAFLQKRNPRGASRAQSKTPAMQAVSQEAMAPPIIALRPRAARSCRREGAMAEIPPIWIPIDEKLAKPVSA